MDQHQQQNQPFKSRRLPLSGGSTSDPEMDIDLINIPPSLPTSNSATHSNNHDQSSGYYTTLLEQGYDPMIGDYAENSQVADSSHPSLTLSIGLSNHENKSNGPNDRRRKLHPESEMESNSSMSIKKPHISDASNNGIVQNIDAQQLLYPGGVPLQAPHWAVPYTGVGPAPHLGHADISMMPIGIYNPSYDPNFVAPSFHYPGSFPQPTNQLMELPYYGPIPSSLIPQYQLPPPLVPLSLDSWLLNSVGDGTSNDTGATISDQELEEILRKFRSFKQFDVVEDVSDHHFLHANSSLEHHSKSWAKRIQAEWKSLEKDLPDTIFVRVYESRIDLLRAVIIGAEGTPYHDGLFLFDVFFPSAYPQVPPV